MITTGRVSSRWKSRVRSKRKSTGSGMHFAPALLSRTQFAWVDTYAVAAFDVHATDYLLKPVSAERLAKAVARGREAAERNPLRTTFRDRPSSRQISLIGLPCTKCSRRIFPIVSTTSIHFRLPVPTGSQSEPHQGG